jgi:hypothetical protein
MRKIIAPCCVALLLSACARPMTICGTTYDSYGLLNSDDKKNPEIECDIVWGNVFWGVVMFEPVIAPIYFFGFSRFEPVGPKPTFDEEDLGWFVCFEGSWERLHVGSEQPTLIVGQKVLIMIEGL